MFLISFIVPSYNAEDYLDRAVESILSVPSDHYEIVIVNDGSNDMTAEIADAYEADHPGMIRVVHKENGGHGSAINTGLLHARGLYFKVLDADDWVDASALATLLETIHRHKEGNVLPDLYIHNFVYENQYTDSQFTRHYRKNLPKDQHFTWDRIKRFRASNTLLMHSLLYRTEILRSINFKLPHHTFYVDNIFAYTPLSSVKSIYYADVDLYRYFIGREDQSIHIKNFSRRYDQQIRVMGHMLGAYSYEAIKAMPKGLSQYMFHNLGVIMLVTHMFAVSGDTYESKAQIQSMWHTLKANDRKLYRVMRFKSLPIMVNYLPWKLRKYVMKLGYKVLQRQIKLG